MSEHIALLGDSIFDNLAYTQGQPDVIAHLRALLPEKCAASLLAIDGSTTAEIDDQLASLPPDVTRVVVSVGGNDALLNADILDFPVASTREALHLFGQRAATFELEYRAAIESVVRREARCTVCTIYNGNFPEDQAPSTRVALMLFNDAILRVAFQLRLDVLDLRLVCEDPADYANPIEPSGQGGQKIARAIAASLGLTGVTSARSRLYAG